MADDDTREFTCTEVMELQAMLDEEPDPRLDTRPWWIVMHDPERG
jgi:hypothetical protein